MRRNMAPITAGLHTRPLFEAAREGRARAARATFARRRLCRHGRRGTPLKPRNPLG
ncbi:hypothetical protein [Methylobacterium brachiatum]|uniref:hypothetical protein n=1 Tax=Methylobacterium brachiatum TaxID=269660 RepID=UPI0024469477|nr:hypothetical protein [Methylobacterium brachiatum]MDH2310954.1 hypothetical protein [Methylobacterium brachiatum]